jgi:hypothetical protein
MNIKEITLQCEKYLDLYAKNMNTFDPISKIIPNWYKNIEKGSFVKILFKNVATKYDHVGSVKVNNGKSMWVLRHPSKEPEFLAKLVMDNIEYTKKLVYLKNGWHYYSPEKKPSLITYATTPVELKCVKLPINSEYTKNNFIDDHFEEIKFALTNKNNASAILDSLYKIYKKGARCRHS